MAHNIGKMFYHGDRPWHGLGTKLERPANIATAIKEGWLDYTVSMVPITVAGEPTSQAPMRRAVVRDDRKPGEDGRVLGVVHPNFVLLQNRDAAALFDGLYGKGREVYTTGGYLKQGEVVWLQAKLAEPMFIGDDKDQLDTYLLFSNSHDGSYPIDIRLTTTRVVCNNTLNIAMKDKDKSKIFRRGHNSSTLVLERDAKEFFERVLAMQAAAREQMDATTRKACDEEAFHAFIRTLMPLPTEPGRDAGPQARAAWETRRANMQNDHNKLQEVFAVGYREPWPGGQQQSPAERTFWGALNAVTAWVDHIQDLEGDRFSNVTFGTGAGLKSKALDLAARLSTPAAAP